MATAEEMLPEVLDAYDFGAPVVGAVRYGSGHINDTFCVHTQPPEDDCRCFILQRMSPVAFRHPDQLMHNIVGITEFLRRTIVAAGGNPERETMTVLHTKTGETWFTDAQSGAWRVYPFVQDTLCIQTAEQPALFAAAGRAFGRFQRMLKDYPADTLYETIPGFHNTEGRLARLKAAAQADSKGRLAEVGTELEFVLSRSADCSVALDALRSGTLPLRVTHNDTKINNVLIDKETGEGICVIDLDTVMPGLSIYDFGDSIRFGANHCAEDEKDLSKMSLDLELYDLYTCAFLEGAAGALTPAELDYLPWGAKLMTFECGIRFLTDYLEGDVYFRIHRPEHNLDRCRTQLKLVADMETHWAQMSAIVDKYR